MIVWTLDGRPIEASAPVAAAAGLAREPAPVCARALRRVLDSALAIGDDGRFAIDAGEIAGELGVARERVSALLFVLVAAGAIEGGVYIGRVARWRDWRFAILGEAEAGRGG